MNIDISPSENDGVERHIKVSFPAEAVKEAEDKAARRYASTVRLPGFRPGKAPAAVVRKKFGEAIRQEALEALVREAYQEVVEKQELKIASQPHVHDLKFAEGQPLTFELHVEVRPKIDLARTSGFKVEKPKVAINDDDVAAQLEQLRDSKATLTPVADKPLPGDLVNVQISTGGEGESAEARTYPIELGAKQAIAGIEELIMEAAPGETVERPVKWPDDFPDEKQRGQTKVVKVTVNDVKRKSLPDLDDAFAREVGDFESLDALRKTLAEDLTRHAEHESEATVRQKLVEEIIAANRFDVPRSWIQDMLARYAEAYGVPEDQKEKFAEEFRPIVERQIRRDLVIETIAEREGLNASEKDIDDRVAEQASKTKLTVGELYAKLEKAGRIKEIERSITEDKVFRWLLDRNEVLTNA